MNGIEMDDKDDKNPLAQWLKRIEIIQQHLERLLREQMKRREQPNFRIHISQPSNVNIFGNRKKKRKEKPVVSIEQDEDKIQVITDLSGYDEENIRVKVSEEKLLIVAKGEQSYVKRPVDLPSPVRKRSGKTTLKNGILTITLDKKD